MKKRMVVLLSITILTTMIAGCNRKNAGSDIRIDENNPSIEVPGGPIVDEDVSESLDNNNESETNSTKLLQGFEAWEDSKAIRALNQVLSLQSAITEVIPSDKDDNKLIQKEYYLNEVDTFLDYKFDAMLIPDKYTVVDLDQDGTPEVVVNLSSGSDGWIKVLRYYEGIVYGYSFVLRGFESPKIDGTYMASSGALDNEIKRLSFNGINVSENRLGSSTLSNDKVIFYIGNEEVSEQEYNVFSNKYNDTQDVTWYLFQSIIRAGYEGQELLRVDFAAKTNIQVQDKKKYYYDMENIGLFTHTSQIPEKLCELIVEAMEHGTEQEILTPLMVDTKISQEEFCSETGLELGIMESVNSVKVDADNDGVEDFIGQHYWGGTGGFSSMEFYKSSDDGQYAMTNTFDCFIQNFGFLQYEGKQYLLMEEFDYNTKYYSGYTLYLYENGVLADGKVFSFVVDDYDMDMVYEDASFAEIDKVKNTLSNTKLPNILQNNDGVIYGTAETKYSNDASEYEYSSDINNDGIQEYYNKSMWYPSNMGTVMRCQYIFEDSMILDDLCNRLSDEMGDGRLYAFWLDEVNGKNLLYLYFGKNMNYSLYGFLIS